MKRVTKLTYPARTWATGSTVYTCSDCGEPTQAPIVIEHPFTGLVKYRCGKCESNKWRDALIDILENQYRDE